MRASNGTINIDPVLHTGYLWSSTFNGVEMYRGLCSFATQSLNYLLTFNYDLPYHVEIVPVINCEPRTLDLLISTLA